jgi:hypothetical protein
MELTMTTCKKWSFDAHALAWVFAALCMAATPNAFSAPDGAGSTADGASPPHTVTADEVQQKWGEAIAAIKGYSANQRDQAIVEAQHMLDAMDERIDQLDAQTRREWDHLSHSARQKREATLHALRRQREDLSEWYGGMKHGSAAAWETVKGGFINAYGTLSDSFSKAVSEFHDSGDENQE